MRGLEQENGMLDCHTPSFVRILCSYEKNIWKRTGEHMVGDGGFIA